jgi:hypothetical protein
MSGTLDQASARLSITLNPCHPERSRAMSEAIRQTESKDPYHPHTIRSDERSFRIAVRFFDEHETEQCPVFSREAAAWENPIGQCPVNDQREASPAGTAPIDSRRTIQ